MAPLILPPSIRAFLDRQLGPGPTPGWTWTAGEIETCRWGWGAAEGFRRLELRIDEARSEASRVLEEDVYFRAAPIGELVWEAGTESIVAWNCPPAARELGPLRLTPDDVLETLRGSLAVPQDGAEEPRVRPARKLTLHLSEITWGRVADGLTVEGDHMVAVVNAATGRLVSYQRGRWAPLPAFDGPSMTEPEARRAAEAEAARRGAGVELDDQALHVLWDEGAGKYRRAWSFWFSVDDPDAEESETPPPDPFVPDELEVVGESTADGPPAEAPGNRRRQPPRKGIVIHVGDDGRCWAS